MNRLLRLIKRDFFTTQSYKTAIQCHCFRMLFIACQSGVILKVPYSLEEANSEVLYASNKSLVHMVVNENGK